MGEPQRWKKEDLDLTELLFSDPSGLDLFQFSELHRACLELPGKSFNFVLSFTSKAAIDIGDNTGRTTLSWAAQRGDFAAVKQLLDRGANPNKPDKSLRTPLHWSIAAESAECMHHLLLNDACVDARDDYGRTALSRVSSIRSDPTLVQTLLEFKADIETKDDEGWTPLHWASHKNQPIALTQLLDSGADCNVMESKGRNPFHVSILRNCHEALKVLVDRNACGEPGRSALGSTFIHSAACYGDVETLRILKSAHTGNVSMAEVNYKGLTAQQIAEWRRDDNEDWSNSTFQPRDTNVLEWYTAFEEFMNHVNEDQQRVVAKDSNNGLSLTRS